MKFLLLGLAFAFIYSCTTDIESSDSIIARIYETSPEFEGVSSSSVYSGPMFCKHKGGCLDSVTEDECNDLSGYWLPSCDAPIPSSSSVKNPGSSSSSNPASSSSSNTSSSSGAQTFDYGSLSYEGKTYRTIEIGEQVWMAENLNYEIEGSLDNGEYGRLYKYEDAKNACPDDWHLPTNEEWDELINFADKTGGSWAGYYLCDSAYETLDKYGFSALLGGFYPNIKDGPPEDGNWWSATFGTSAYYYRTECVNYGFWQKPENDLTIYYSVRCLKKN